MSRVPEAPTGAYLPALGLWIVAAGYLGIAYTYAPETRALPVAVGWSMLALVGLDLASRMRGRAGAALTRWLNPRAHGARQKSYPAATQLGAVFWILGFAAALVLIGVLAAVPLYVFASLRLRGKRPFATSLAAAAGITLAVWLLFSALLRLDLFPGLLFGGG